MTAGSPDGDGVTGQGDMAGRLVETAAWALAECGAPPFHRDFALLHPYMQKKYRRDASNALIPVLRLLADEATKHAEVLDVAALLRDLAERVAP